VHIAGRSTEISTGDCSRWLVRIEVTRVDALGCLLVLRYIAIHALCEVLTLVWLGEEKASQRLAYCYRLRSASREGITAFVSHHDDSFAVLRDKVVDRVQELYVYYISKSFKPLLNLIQVPTVFVEKSAYVLKHPKARSQLLHGCNKCRKAIPRIFEPKLKSTDAEWLTGRASNDDISRWKSGVDRKELLDALSMKICVIGCTAIGVYFVSQRLKASGFKPKRKATTSGEEIQNQLWPSNRRTQSAIRHGGVGFGLQGVFRHGYGHSGIWYADSPFLRSLIRGREKCLVGCSPHLIT